MKYTRAFQSAEYVSENPGIAAVKEASRIAAQTGISEMSLDEINAEIAAARDCEKSADN